MAKRIDLLFGFLLALGGVAHGVGCWYAYHTQSGLLLWALCASFAVILLAAVNILRAFRQTDRPLAWICLAGCLVWIGFVLWFGRLLGNMFDWRALTHLILTTVLAVFCIQTIRRTAVR